MKRQLRLMGTIACALGALLGCQTLVGLSEERSVGSQDGGPSEPGPGGSGMTGASAGGPNQSAQGGSSDDSSRDGGTVPMGGPTGEGGDTAGMGGASAGMGGASAGTGGAGGDTPDPPSDNADLGSLTVTPGFMSPAFNTNTTSYASSIPVLASEVSVVATAADDEATLSINGAAATSGQTTALPVPENGELAIEIEVKAEDGTTRDYSVMLTRREITYFKASDTAERDHFATSVALDGDTLVVGAANRTGGGAVYVFQRINGVWGEQQILTAPNADPPATDPDDAFGVSVAMQGDTLAVGAYLEDSNARTINGDGSDNSAVQAGAAYVFQRRDGEWSFQAYIKASDAAEGHFFGRSLDLDGDTLAVGASGAGAYVFQRSNGIWSEQAALDEPGGVRAVAVDGDILAVGGDNIVRIFKRTLANWVEQDVLPGPDGENFGAALALDGDMLAASASVNEESVYLFQRSGQEWPQQIRLEPDVGCSSSLGSSFGRDLALSGHTLAASCYDDSSAKGVNGNASLNDAPGSGAVLVFRRTNGTWSQVAYVKSSNPDSGDELHSISLSGDALAVGAPLEDGSATGIDGVQSNNSTRDSGAVYLY